MTDVADRLNAALRGRYRIERELGEGGMARVYLAHDLKHKRDVAIKVLRAELGDVASEARFRREIEIAARLTHPHIVPLHDSGEADGLHYFVMPVITGGSLAERIDGPLPPDEVTRFVHDIATGLDYAHRSGIVHRDLKPANILLHEGAVMISDLGIALDRMHASDTRVTRTGASLGTPAYMSPEQLHGAGELDARSDVYALGCIAFEMLTGRRPFEAETQPALAAKVLTEPPPRASTFEPSLPSAVDTVLTRALAKAAADRFASAGDVARALADALAPPATAGRRTVTKAAIVAVALTAAAVLWQTWERRSRDAALAAVATVDSLVEVGDWAEAYMHARKITHPAALEALEPLRPRFSAPFTIATAPPGATVAIRRYAAPHDPWIALGTTPLEARLPSAVIALRLERDGQDPVEFNPHPAALSVFGGGVIPLGPEGPAPEGMIAVPGAVVDLGEYAAGLWGIEPLEIGDFFIDRYEVRNAEYAAFVAAGGYENPEYWPATLLIDGRSVPFSDVGDRFVDRTGRPGPSTWDLGAPLAGREDHPVTGISWYEARAYARFVGKRLPTVYHWHRAVGGWLGELMLPRSNIGTTGTVPVGSTAGESEWGLRDAAGNAREWVVNTDGALPLTLGGGWSDDATKFFDATMSFAAWDRSDPNGVRLMTVRDTTGLTAAEAPIDVPRRDFFAATPASDIEFRIYRNLFDYDDVPLDARIEEVDTTDLWTRQEITFETGFSPVRMKIHLFLPPQAGPDTEIVIHFPGSGVVRTSQPLEEITWTGEEWNFVIKTGRALVFPVFLGTMERSDGFRYRLQDDTRAYRDHVIAWGRELGRTLDYLETRDDLSHDAIGYYGFSWGARLGAIMLAIHPRLDAAVLHSGGLSPIPVQPEADPFNYLPRVTQPVMMINSRFENVYPIETSVRPYLARLGTPEDLKELVITDGGHFVSRNDLVRETLRWFDTHLSGRD